MICRIMNCGTPRRLAGCLLAALWFVSTANLWAVDANPIEPAAAETWGEDTQVVQAGRFYIAGQPDEAALQQARARDVSIVISLRGPTESDWDEAAAAESLGLEFHRVPLDGMADELAAEPLVGISEIVQANPDANVMVHCSTGTRASAWFATYLANYLGMETDKAIDIANRTGLNRDSMRDKVRHYLEH